jgi:hypothetical protein
LISSTANRPTPETHRSDLQLAGTELSCFHVLNKSFPITNDVHNTLYTFNTRIA